MIKIKHNIKITLILLGMFLITQFIGIYVVNSYLPVKVVDGNSMNISDSSELQYGMAIPPVEEQVDYFNLFFSLIIAFAIAISFMLLLTKFKADFIIKFWFFFVVVISLGLAIFPLTSRLNIEKIIWEIPLVATLIALPLAFFKIYRTNFLIHNLTELLIYPGIAAVFVPILNLKTMIIFLILISVYDMWAVWSSGIMQKMAKFQIQKLKIFSGFFVPYVSKKIKFKIQQMKAKFSKGELKNKKIKVNVAILGGGDVVFPILASGVMLKEFGFKTILGMQVPLASIFVILGAALGLSYLLFFSEKKKFYPAMPFITSGIFLGMILYWLLL